MAQGRRETFFENFKRFFFRGLAIVLPTILTVWLLIAAYNFVDNTIAEPVNQGIRNLVLRFSAYPSVTYEEWNNYLDTLDQRDRHDLMAMPNFRNEVEYRTRKDKLLYLWRTSGYPLDLIGVAVVMIVIYMAGGLLGSFLGRRIYQRGEQFVSRLPLIRSVYPAVKQLTDYFFGGKEQKMRFQRVVAVEYPRRGMWSIGLVTGGSWDVLDAAAGKRCVTVYLPSTPMGTGYAVVIPAEELITLPISIDEALKRIVSGGVLGPAVDGTIVMGGASPLTTEGGPGPAPTAMLPAEPVPQPTRQK